MLIEAVVGTSKKYLDVPQNYLVENLFGQLGLNQVSNNVQFFVICNGKIVDKNTNVQNGKIYHIIPRINGGKGGFGSMLRAIGAQIEKTTSREACRDLSGRRMRDINNEKKLKDWLAKEAEREQEREERKKEKLERLLKPQHKFDDAEYHEQKAKVQDDLQEALSTGLKRKVNGDKGGPSQSKISKTKGNTSKKEWLGMDLDSDDLDSSDSETEANPGSPGPSSSSELIRANSHSGDMPSTASATLFKDAGGGQIEEQIGCKSTPSDTNKDTSKDAVNVSDSDMKSSESQGEETDVPSDTPVDLDNFSSSTELQALGLDRLKYALVARGLKCGGTLCERADRLFIIKGLSSEDIKERHSSLLAKVSGKGGKGKKSQQKG